MRIIGVDPGSRKMGFGIIDVDPKNRSLQHIAHGVLRLNVTRDIGERVCELAHRLKEIVELHRPTRCALEDIFVAEGMRSALMLGQARGAVLATMGLLDIPVQHFAPTKVKLALTGTGRASKLQVSEMVRILLAICEKPAEDAGDALAIAICGAHHSVFLPTGALLHSQPQKRVGLKRMRNALEDIARRQGKVG